MMAKFVTNKEWLLYSFLMTVMLASIAVCQMTAVQSTGEIMNVALDQDIADLSELNTTLQELGLGSPEIQNSFLLADRQQLLQEAINEVLGQSGSFSLADSELEADAQFFGLLNLIVSVVATATNKQGSQQADKEGIARNKLEEILKRYEAKQINAAKGLTTEQKEALQCIHHFGDFTTSKELKAALGTTGCEIPKPHCSLLTQKYRTIDGTCNNVAKPTQGKAQSAFRRLIPPFYEDGIEVPRGRQQSQPCLKGFKLGPFDPPTPSARLVSRKIIQSYNIQSHSFTHMIMQWGQFLDHDIDLAPEEPHKGGPCKTCKIENDCEPIKIEPGDTLKGSTADGKCINFRRSTAVCSTNALTPREQLNDITSYMDGSQIYGSDTAKAKSLRKPCPAFGLHSCKGKMDTSAGNLLPVVSGKCGPQTTCFVAGDVRANEQIGLTAMHTLFIREHNRIASNLQRINPRWDSNRIYEETRRIVGAILQKITYEDYLPKVLGTQGSQVVLRPYTGYKSNVDSSIPNVFATAALRYGHSLVQPSFITYSTDRYEHGPKSSISLKDAFFSFETFKKAGVANILRGLVTQSSMRNDEYMNSVLTSHLFEKKGSPGLDLAALNIQRGRDHGLPVYSAWRAYCKTIYPKLPDGVIGQILTLKRIYEVYGTPEVADLFVAGLTERRFKDSILGPTFACIFGITFSDLRDGDRFYYENKGVFTPDQLREIKKATLSDIICRNSGTEIKSIQRDAFAIVGTLNKRVTCSCLPTMNFGPWKSIWQQSSEQSINEEEGEDEVLGEEQDYEDNAEGESFDDEDKGFKNEDAAEEIMAEMSEEELELPEVEV